MDIHSIKSVPIADGIYDTERTELGQALFLLKYRNDTTQIRPIADTGADFLRSGQNQWWFNYIKVIIPVPPSNFNRPFQPVWELAGAISNKVEIRYDNDYLFKTKDTDESKNIGNPEERRSQLEDAFSVRDNRYSGGTVLVFDDIYDNGTTLESACKAINEKGHTRFIYALTVTTTRKKQ